MPSKKTDTFIPELSPLSIVRMVWKQKKLIIAVLILAVAATAVVVYRLPAIYQAEALVLVDSQKIPSSYVTSTVNTDVGDRLATISQEIMTTSRLLTIINNYNLYPEERKHRPQEEIIEEMRKDISLHLEKGWTGGRPGAFRVGYKGTNPTLVAEIANQLANLYVEENLKTREVQAEGTSEFIDSQVNEAKKKLDELEAKVSAFKVKHTGELPEQENSLLSMISSLQTQLQGNQDAINRAQQNRITLESMLETAQAADRILSTPRGAAGASADGGPVPKKRSEIMQEQLDRLRLLYTDDYPDVKLLKEEIQRAKLEEQKDAKAAAAAAAASKSGQGTAAPTRSMSREQLASRERINDLETRLTLAKKEVAYLENERETILKNIALYQSRVDHLPIVEQEMAAMTRDYEISKTNYKSLLDKQISASMATDMERRQKSERFEIIDPARVPELPISPNRPLLSVVGVALSIALALLFGFGIEIRKSALLGEWELPAGMVVFGRVPTILPTLPPARNMRRIAAVCVTAVISIVAIGMSAYFVWGRS
jgi:protein tyrosine kinase modulator